MAGASGTRPRAATKKGMTLTEWLSEPEAVARRGEVWGVLQRVLEIQRQNVWWRKVWRWALGKTLIEINPFRLWRLRSEPTQLELDQAADEQAATSRIVKP